MAKTKARKGMPSVAPAKAGFTRRARERFIDPAFPQPGPGQRPDGRDLPDLGGRPRRHDRDAGEMVAGAVGPEGDDRSPGAPTAAIPTAKGQGSRDEGLGLSAPPCRPRRLGGRARRHRGDQDAAPHPGRLVEGQASRLGRARRRARSLCRLYAGSMRRATTRSTATRPSRKKRATPRGLWSRP